MAFTESYNSNDVPHRNLLSARAFDYIQEKIITREFPKDSTLNEIEITRELGISRTPVREAIKQLEKDGLVRSEPNYGAIVVGLSIEDMENILIIRAFLEGLCAKWAAEKMTNEQREMLQEALDLQKFYLDRNNLTQCWKAGNKFHSIIYDSYNSRQVVALLHSYHNYIYLWIKKDLLKRNIEHPQLAFKDHVEILDAINKRDAELSEQLMREHLERTRYTL